MTTEPRPGAAAAPPPVTAAEQQLDALLTERFYGVVERHPVFATYLGIHDHDDKLGDGSREAVQGEIDEARAFLGRLESVPVGELSPYWALERELAQFSTRRHLFDDDVHRVWERRVSATDEIGDGVFLLFARGTRPLAERLSAIASRLEAGPQHIEEQKSRLGQRPMRLWNEMELDSAESLPSLFDEVIGASRGELGDDHAQTRRLERAAAEMRTALDGYKGWIRERLAEANDEFALGSDAYDELIGLRAFDGLTADDILEIGEQQLAENKAARARAAQEVDPAASENEVIDRIKTDHPADFAAALDSYRTAMGEARQFVIDHDIASMPAGETLSVIETPEYLRNVMPFAAYFSPPKFESGPNHEGIYIVTASVDGDPRAMREHNMASIYNTSIHEAYPGHHQQLAAANENPSLTRMLVDAPEFVEGWAMYCELMMREEGFDTSAEHRLMMHTDAIWRACRIILDVKLHRGQIGVGDATDFMVEQTGFERPNAAAEVRRYTYTPSYQLSYLLGRVLLLRLREDEKRRLGDKFSLRNFHDAMLRQGSLPISFHRRILAAEA
ncbi:MAG TPA: DUF885 domain-containing protein [Candidatus Limnocylindrales bacterium]|nr:DUF885 domain-containing protein [Candidatus Limnocylindrales bacterium]